ncbi:hypothetical protein B296_00039009 [Ensete ventricosum]|uniref:Uncharacterized protein n=1 Tax=Ensete ventricosum TaxID=4639 RepID=A0A426Y7B0_ENSVE|nr:hypothetical protein B296_00039009 [Ensete ventricosum]
MTSVKIKSAPPFGTITTRVLNGLSNEEYRLQRWTLHKGCRFPRHRKPSPIKLDRVEAEEDNMGLVGEEGREGEDDGDRNDGEEDVN